MSRQRSFVSVWTQKFRDSYVPEPTARAVGYALATFANADGSSIRPGHARLMVAASLHSETSVTKGIKLLLRWQWIELVAEGTPERAAEYRLTLPASVAGWVAGGAETVACYRKEKRERNAATADRRRDRRHGIRP